MFRTGIHALCHAAIAFLAFHCSTASAGWYQIKNYEGTIGTAPVHLSLQAYDKLKQGDARLTGSYYYNAHRIPLKLDGIHSASGEMTLCESTIKAGDDVDNASKPRCTITLNAAPDGLQGRWKDGAASLDIRLHQVGSLDNNQDERIDGKVDIPMWYHTRKAMFIGVYQKSSKCEQIVMTNIRIGSTANGSVLDTLRLDSGEAGTLMTDIYRNVEYGVKPRNVTIHYGGGKMGHDELAPLKPAAY
jgi:hypothetical protein